MSSISKHKHPFMIFNTNPKIIQCNQWNQNAVCERLYCTSLWVDWKTEQHKTRKERITNKNKTKILYTTDTEPFPVQHTCWWHVEKSSGMLNNTCYALNISCTAQIRWYFNVESWRLAISEYIILLQPDYLDLSSNISFSHWYELDIKKNVIVLLFFR